MRDKLIDNKKGQQPCPEILEEKEVDVFLIIMFIVLIILFIYLIYRGMSAELWINVGKAFGYR